MHDNKELCNKFIIIYEAQKVQVDDRQDIKFADKLNIYYDEVISANIGKGR